MANHTADGTFTHHDGFSIDNTDGKWHELIARAAGVLAEIRTEHFPNTCPEPYRCSKPLFYETVKRL